MNLIMFIKKIKRVDYSFKMFFWRVGRGHRMIKISNIIN